MRRLGICVVAAVAVLVGGSATVASAQTVGDPEVSIDNAEPEAGGTINVTVSNLEPETAVSITLGDSTAEGVADADGTAVIAVQVPAEPGDIDGAVNVGGVEIPFAVSVQGAGDGGDGTEGGDGTPQPTVVNTGELDPAGNTALLFAAAACLLLLAGGALVLRQRSTEG